MGININNVAAYIHGQAPAKLDGLFYAVEAKCKELKLTPGRRDNVAGSESNAVSGNMRGVLNFVAGVQPITDDDRKALGDSPEDRPAKGDSKVVLAEKENRRANRPFQEDERKRRLAAKEADHEALRKLYGTLLARFASAGYKPKPLVDPATAEAIAKHDAAVAAHKAANPLPPPAVASEAPAVVEATPATPAAKTAAETSKPFGTTHKP